jgi:hypothetical protein
MAHEPQLENTTDFDYAQDEDRIDTFMRITGMYDHPEEALQNQYRQLDEEVEELYSACVSHNQVEILDGIGDCVFVYVTIILLKAHLQDVSIPTKAFFTLQGLISLVDTTQDIIEYCLDVVVESNLSKFDKDMTEASNTVAHYATLNIKTEALFDTKSGLWFVKVTRDCTDINGKTYHKGKILKSVTNYRGPDFSLALKDTNNDNSIQ